MCQHLEDWHNSVNQCMMLKDYAWMKYLLKVQQNPMNCHEIVGKFHWYDFRFHIATNL